jgi:imidazole glycerol-phosphate synthase subunit HisH
MERLLLIDYGSGNLRSAAKALERAAVDAGRAVRVLVSGDAEEVACADRIVLPGVGAFGQCSGALRAVPGLLDALETRVLRGGIPFLGICVGMQLMADVGREHGDHQGLGWISGEVRALAPSDPALKIPHMGWNDVALSARFAGLPMPAQAYFVHSYAFTAANPAHVLATTDYGGSIAAIIGRDNLLGTQFHPEKSQAFGLALLGQFLAWRP